MSKARIIASTQWDENIEIDTEHDAEDIISYCARVSNPSNQENFDTSDKLLKYCLKHKHWSIFEMANIVIEINTTRDISRQILRHSSLKPQEFSQRYANISEMGFEKCTARLQDETNRQNSIELDPSNAQHVIIGREFLNSQQAVWDFCINEYNRMIEFGVAKESARKVLPEGLTMSRMYLSGTVRDWFHYSQVRMNMDTQKEHRVVAEEVWELISEKMPFLKSVEVEI